MLLRARPGALVNVATPTLAAARFAAQVRATPGAPALVTVAGTLDYASLARRVDALVALLLANGVGPGVSVGLALDRTADLVASVWACLRLGAPFVPLDPAYPRARLEHMAADAGVTVLLADRVGRAAVAVPATLVDPADIDPAVTADAEAGATASGTAPAPDELAYVIYTSGSTGVPKGVQIDQANLAHFLDAMAPAVHPVPGERPGVFLAATTLSFDPSIVELVWALTAGFTVVLSPSLAGPVHLRASLGTLIRRHGVTHAQLTPSRARVLLADVDERGALAQLHQVFVGGEILTAQLAADLLEAGIGTVTNLYGPTETTVWAFAHDVVGGPDEVRAAGPVPVGRPLPGYRVRLRGADGSTVAPGEVGEVLIGGGGVSRGYRNRPELVARRFLPDAELGPAYATGDLARGRADGVLEFVGRADDQVKIEGYRIEPAEVERALAGTPGTSQVVVVARGDEPKRLVAYAVTAEDAPRDPADVLEALRSFGAERLPGYMLPTAAVVVDAFDLTPSGKVDRSRLPDPAAVAGDDAVAAPGGPDAEAVQDALAAWWAELLGRRRVRADEDFFDLGGDSTLAVRLLARVQRAWGVRLGLATLVSAPTVQALAPLVVAAATGGDRPGDARCLVSFAAGEAVSRAPAEGPRPLVVVHGAGGNVLNLTAMARHLAEVRPVVGVQARGVDGTTAPDGSIDAMADRYVAELRRYQPDGPYLLGGYSGGGVVAIEMARRLLAAGAAVPAVVLFDTYPPGTDEPGTAGKLANVARNLVHHGPVPVLRSLAVIVRRRLSGRVVADPAALGYGDVSELGLAKVDRHFNEVARRHRSTPVDVAAVLLRAEVIQASLPPATDWTRLLVRPPAERTVPGHHYSMFDAAHAGALAAVVQDVLRGADGRRPA